MASSSNPGARAMAKQLKVLLPPSLHKLRISDELAGCLDAAASTGGGAGTPGPTTLVVSPFGKVWRVEVGRDGDGAFLGRGWPEFLAAHGVGVGWFVVIRHEGGGALTVKAFDTSFCIKEFGAPSAVMASGSSKEVSCKPQFIRVIHQDFMENMMIPAKFVKRYVTEEYMNSRTAVVFSPLNKFWRIELENDQSDMYFAGGWSQFLAFHGISEGEALILTYEGNMVFKLKVFGLNGCQKDFKNQNTGIQQMTDIEKEQESPSPRIRKRKSNNARSSCEEEKKRPKSSMTPLNKASSQKEPDYQIGPPSWIKKETTTYMLKSFLSLSVKFCHSIGFRNACTIMLKTTMDSTRSWQVRGLAYNYACYLLGEGWKRFCQENRLKKGDMCIFNVIETTLWHVVITRSSTLTDIQKQKKSPSSSSRDRETKNDRPSSEGHERRKGSMNSLNKAPSYTESMYEIGPPSWIQKQITANSLKKQLCLSKAFFYAIGLRSRQPRTITLRTSINSPRSWQVGGRTHKKASYLLVSDWKNFWQENRLKVGDVCTFNIVETMLWHVVITRG